MGDGYTEADRRMVADVHHRLTCQGCVSGRGGCAGVDEADEEYADASLAALAGAGRLRPEPSDAVEDATAVFWTAVDRALGGRDDFPDSLPPGLQAAMQAGLDALAARRHPPADAVQVVAEALAAHATRTAEGTRVHYPAEWREEAEVAVAALAVRVLPPAAGRLRPEDTRTEYGVRWHDTSVVVDGYVRETAVAVGAQYEHAEAVQRRVGPWVPVPTPPGDTRMCGAFQPAAPPLKPFRCTEPAGHGGSHRAIVDGETVAVWMRAGLSEEKP